MAFVTVKRTILGVCFLVVVLAIGVLIFHGLSQSDRSPSNRSSARTTGAKAAGHSRADAVVNGGVAKRAPVLASNETARGDTVRMFDDGGTINAEFIARYGLKAPDVARLAQARDDAVAELATLDVRHVQLDPGNDENVFRGTIAPYPKEGAAIHDQFYGQLREVLGDDGYRDYIAQEHVIAPEVAAYEIRYAGLFQKEFVFDRSVDASGQPVIKFSVNRTLHFPAGTEGLASTPTDVKSSTEGSIRTRTELRGYDSFLVNIAPSWVP